MNWLQPIIDWIQFIWPFTKVSPWQKAIRFTYLPGLAFPWRKNNKWVLIDIWTARVIQKELGPGMHRKIAWIEEVENHSVVADTFETQIQNITTKDGTSVTFRVSVVYEIFNVVKAHCEVHDYENSMRSLTMIHASRVVRRDDFEAVRVSLDSIEEELRVSLHEDSKKWGTRIKNVGLTSFVKSEQFNRFQTQ